MGIYKGYKQTEDHKERRAKSRIKNALDKSGLTYLERRKKFRSENVELRIYSGMQARAKNRFPIDISLVQFREFFSETPKICDYCETPVCVRNPNRKQTLSIDRKYNEIGYTKDNICIACYRCNTVKSDVFNYDQMKEIAIKYFMGAV